MNPKYKQLPVLRFETESGSEDVYYPVIYDGFPEKFSLMAKKELKETEEKRLKGLQILNDHIKSKNLHGIPEYVLLAVLRVSKNDMKTSIIKLKKFLKNRKEIVDMIAETGLRKTELILDSHACGLLPYRDRHGRFIYYTNPSAFDLKLFTLDDVIIVGLALALFLIQYPITTVSGGVYFMDYKSFPSSYTYAAVKTAHRLMWYPFALPIRFGKVNVLNPLTVAYLIYKATGIFLPHKIKKRIYFHHHGYDELQKEYSKNILPEEFGGNMGPLDNSHFKEQFLEFARKLIEENRKLS